MNVGKLWADFVHALPHDLISAERFVAAMLANPISRGALLILLVYLTIRVIASVYAGDKQRAELGPVAIRPHTSNRYDRNTVRMPHELMPMSMDGVSARCHVFYVYNDSNGRRRKELLHTIKDACLSVSPVRLPAVQNMLYGQEITEGAETKYVCFPASDLQEPENPIPTTPALATEYAKLHQIIEKWTEDDSAVRISMSSDLKEEIAYAKDSFVSDQIVRMKKAETGLINRLKFRSLYKKRPNVVGSLYLKFEFSHEPLFVLTRHPDRDLKMTAWLTILTSMFALIMDWWPNGSAPFGLVVPGEVHASAPDVTKIPAMTKASIAPP